MSKEKIEKMKLFQYYNNQGNNSNGASGGIVTFWNSHTIKGDPILEGTNHIATRFTHIRDNFSWIQVNIYAPNGKGMRKSFWLDLVAFRRIFDREAWMVMGDFNTPLMNGEKFGGS